MNELKTLKDFWKENRPLKDDYSDEDLKEDGKQILLRELKAEAIKWVKTDKKFFRVITKENTAPPSHLSPGGTLIQEDNSKITEFILDTNLRRFLFYFFNLTEKELER